MSFRIIENPDFGRFSRRSGFTNTEFKKLAGLFSQGASCKALYDMAVDVDFEAGTCTVTYYVSRYEPAFRFVIRHVGPRASHYEVYKHGKGLVERSGLFARAFARLEQEIIGLFPPES